MGNADLDEVAPTFRELLVGSGISFVQARVSEVDLGEKVVSVMGALSDDLDGFMISDDVDESELTVDLKYAMFLTLRLFCVCFYFCSAGRLHWTGHLRTRPRIAAFGAFAIIQCVVVMCLLGFGGPAYLLLLVSL